jgi:hypothetical protein
LIPLPGVEGGRDSKPSITFFFNLLGFLLISEIFPKKSLNPLVNQPLTGFPTELWAILYPSSEVAKETPLLSNIFVEELQRTPKNLCHRNWS